LPLVCGNVTLGGLSLTANIWPLCIVCVLVACQMSAMRYAETVDLARCCALNARLAPSKELAKELWKMAVRYQVEAGDLDGGAQPDIGSLPTLLRN
jgi:hypothetical protein